MVRFPTTSPARHLPESRRLARRIVRFRTTAPARHLPESRRLARRIVRFSDYITGSASPRIPPAHPADRSTTESRRLARRIVPAIPPARPADRSVSDYSTGSGISQNPAGSPGGSFGFGLQRTGSASPRIPPARPGGRSVSDYSTGSASRKSAGSPGGSFGFRTTAPARHLPTRRLARRIVRFPTTSPARHLPESAGSPGGSFGFGLQHRLGISLPPALARRIVHHRIPPAQPADRSVSDYITGSASPKIPPAHPADRSPQNPPAHPADRSPQNPAGPAGGSFGFRLHHRLGISRIPPARPADRSPQNPPARPADRSVSDYITGSASPKIPPARPADRSVSDYITGSASPKIPPARPADRSRRIPPARPADRSPQNPPARPADRSVSTTAPARHLVESRRPSRRIVHRKSAGSPGGSFGFGLQHRLGISQNPAGSPGGSFGFGLQHRLGISQKSRRLARRIVRRTTAPARHLPKPPARPADRCSTTAPARHLPKSRRLARRIVRFPDYSTGSASRRIPPAHPTAGSVHHRSAGPAGGSFGFDYITRLGIAESRRPSRRIVGFRLHLGLRRHQPLLFSVPPEDDHGTKTAKPE